MKFLVAIPLEQITAIHVVDLLEILYVYQVHSKLY